LSPKKNLEAGFGFEPTDFARKKIERVPWLCLKKKNGTRPMALSEKIKMERVPWRCLKK
jgi:hypothetical protein